MASILVYIESDGEGPKGASLEALGEARRIASTLGATLYAYVPMSASAAFPGSDEGEWVHALGTAGADKVVMMAMADEAPGPRLWLSHGRAMHAVCMHLDPTLAILAATDAGRDIAPRLAARSGATFIAEPSLSYGPRGQIALTRRIYGGVLSRRLSLEDIDSQAVITLTPGSHARARGFDEAEALCLHPPIDLGPAPEGRLDYMGSVADPGAALESAEVVVVAGGGVSSTDTYALVEALADALGGELAATATLCARGIAPPERAVGVGFRHVSPTLYVACGASGSPGHLGAICPDADIIALNNDPEAPIFQVANYGLVGDLEVTIPSIIAELRQRRKTSATASQ